MEPVDPQIFLNFLSLASLAFFGLVALAIAGVIFLFVREWWWVRTSAPRAGFRR